MPMQSSPESIVRSWSNASQIETVRIEHTKVSPVNIGNIGQKQEESKTVNATSTSEKKLVEKMDKDNEGDEIEMEVERSGDGKSKDIEDIDHSSLNGRKTGVDVEYGAGSLLNVRTSGGAGRNNLKIGLAIPDTSPVNDKFAEEYKAEDSQGRKLAIEDSNSAKPHAKNKVSGHGSPAFSHGRIVPGGTNSKQGSADDQIDVTVFFDNNSDGDFANEVSSLKSGPKSKDHGKFSSLRKNLGIDDFTVQKVSKNPGRDRQDKNVEGHFFSLPFRAVMQPSDAEDEENSDEEENSRSKGEIPEGDAEEDDEKDPPAPGMYDMRESLPFFSVPVADQHGYSLIAPVFEPYQDSPYQPGLDLVSAEEASLIGDDSDFYEPQTLKHTWKRSLQEPLLKEQKLPALAPQVSSYSKFSEKNGFKYLRRQRRGIPQQVYFPEIRKPPNGFISPTKLMTKRNTGILSARKRFTELLRKVHERSVRNRRFVGHDSIPARLFGRHTLLSENTNLWRPQVHLPNRRWSVEKNDIERQHSIAPANLQSNIGRSRRRRRSVGEPETTVKSQRDELTKTNSNATVYREKRNKIIDDYDDYDTDDFENEPHVVKRSAIFGSLDSSLVEEDDAEFGKEKVEEDPRTKRQADDENEEDGDDPEGERRQMASVRRVSSLEGSLRKKLLSMKTQSKSVLKLLKRVHEDISGGDTEDLFKLEAEIADIEKREKEKLGKFGDREEKHPQKSKSHKKIEKHTNREKTKEKLKAKSVTPDIKENVRLSSENGKDDGTVDSVETQEKLAYKKDPDEYLRYGAGNTGVLESWTLVFYGT